MAVLLAGTIVGGGADGADPLTDAQLLPMARCIALHIGVMARMVERMQGFVALANTGTCGFSSPNFSAIWNPCNLDSIEPSFRFGASDAGVGFAGQIFEDSDTGLLAVFGQLDGIDTGFLIDTDTFEVFED